MAIYSFYTTATGYFTGQLFDGPAEQLVVNTPAGTSALEGAYDYLSQRYNLGTEEVEDYIPSAPADTDYETWVWNTTTKRWDPVETLYSKKKKRIAALEAERDAFLSTPLTITGYGDLPMDEQLRSDLDKSISGLADDIASGGANSMQLELIGEDPVVLTVTIRQARAVRLVANVRKQEAYALLRELRTDVWDAVNEAGVNAVTWPVDNADISSIVNLPSAGTAPALVTVARTRAQLNTAASAGQLSKGEIYLIDDEDRMAIGTSSSTFQAAAKQGEGGSGTGSGNSYFPGGW